MNDSFSLYVLLSHPGISPAVARQLIQLFGSAEAVLCESKNTINPPDGVRNSLWKKLKNPEARKKQKRSGEKLKNKLWLISTIEMIIFLFSSTTFTMAPCFCFIEENPFRDQIKSSLLLVLESRQKMHSFLPRISLKQSSMSTP